MRKLFVFLAGFLFLTASGLALADEGYREDRHEGVRVIVAPTKHHHPRRRRVKVVRQGVELKVGIGVHDNRWHYDHDYDDHWRASHRWHEDRHDWDR